MGNSSEPKFEFLILNRPSAPIPDLKTILCERKIKSQADELHFCSWYIDLYAEYTVRFNGEEMWGVRLPKLSIYTELWDMQSDMKRMILIKGVAVCLYDNTIYISLK